MSKACSRFLQGMKPERRDMGIVAVCFIQRQRIFVDVLSLVMQSVKMSNGKTSAAWEWCGVMDVPVRDLYKFSPTVSKGGSKMSNSKGTHRPLGVY